MHLDIDINVAVVNRVELAFDNADVEVGHHALPPFLYDILTAQVFPTYSLHV